MKTAIRISVIAALALATVQAVFAQGGLKDLPPGKWWVNKRLIAELRLSAEQQARIDTLWMQNRRQLIDQRAELEKRQLDLTVLLEQSTVDEAAALKAFDLVQETRSGIERATFQMRLQIKNILSAEQQLLLERIAGRLRLQRARGAEPLPGTPPALPANRGAEKKKSG